MKKFYKVVMIHNKFKHNDNVFLDNQSIELFLAESILNHGKSSIFSIR